MQQYKFSEKREQDDQVNCIMLTSDKWVGWGINEINYGPITVIVILISKLKVWFIMIFTHSRIYCSLKHKSLNKLICLFICSACTNF